MNRYPLGTIPVKSTWCRYCHAYDEATGRLRFTGHCAQHPAGADYDSAKDNAYEPSDFVMQTVGRVFQGPFAEGVYYCYGYDPRCGFFVRNVADATDIRDLSERAIGRTFHDARTKLALHTRSLYDLDEQMPYCVHDWDVPAAEEMLALHLFLSVPGYETYLRAIPHG